MIRANPQLQNTDNERISEYRSEFVWKDASVGVILSVNQFYNYSEGKYQAPALSWSLQLCLVK